MRLITKITAFAVVNLTMATLTANGAPGDLFASVNGAIENGAGFIYEYTPDGVQSTFASGLSRPRGLAFDSMDNLFVATNFCDADCHPTILEFAPDGTQTLFATLDDKFFAQGVAIDGSDNTFVLETFQLNRSLIYKITPDGQRTAFGVFRGQAFDLDFDSAGNLFAADSGHVTIYEFAPDGTRSVFVGHKAFNKFTQGPIGLAFDQFGNLFVSTEVFPFTDDQILKFTPSGVRNRFANGLASPRGLAFDSAGNLFVAEIPPSAAGDILKFTPDGMRTVFASGIGDPQGNGGPEYLAIQP